MFGTLGGPELFLILIIALIVFGPRKLPEIGKSLGKMIAEFRKASTEFRQTIENEVEADKLQESMRIELPRVDEPKASASSSDAATKEAAPATTNESPPETVTSVSRDPDHALHDPK